EHPVPGSRRPAGGLRCPEDLQSRLRLFLCVGRLHGRLGGRLVRGGRGGARAPRRSAGRRPPGRGGAGGPPALFVVPLVVAGLAGGAVGVVVERGLLRFVYDRDETFQLLLTFAVVLMMEDSLRMIWGTAPRSTSGLYLTYGQLQVLGAPAPVSNLFIF